jgi:hypothetical protein
MRGLLAGIALAAIFAGAAHRTTVLDPGACTERGQGGAVSFGAWAAWSRYDTTSGECSLVVRSPRGVISTPAVPQNPGPFDVELGPSAHGVVAVFSGCFTVTCGIYELRLGHASAKRLAVPLRVDLREPAIWQHTLVFLAQHRLVVWRLGARRVRALRLPRTQGRHGWPRGETGPISGLTISGSRVAFVTSPSNGTFADSTLWTERIGQRPQLVDQLAAGAGNVCPPAILSPVIAGGWLYAYVHACPAGGGPISDDRFTRYSLRDGSAARADHNFIHFIDDEIFSVVPYRDGALFDNGVVALIRSLTWQTIARPVPETFCSRSHPFC